jgi:hypothetical protein
LGLGRFGHRLEPLDDVYENLVVEFCQKMGERQASRFLYFGVLYKVYKGFNKILLLEDKCKTVSLSQEWGQ